MTATKQIVARTAERKEMLHKDLERGGHEASLKSDV
jgi:hypothetical protein